MSKSRWNRANLHFSAYWPEACIPWKRINLWSDIRPILVAKSCLSQANFYTLWQHILIWRHSRCVRQRNQRRKISLILVRLLSCWAVWCLSIIHFCNCCLSQCILWQWSRYGDGLLKWAGCWYHCTVECAYTLGYLGVIRQYMSFVVVLNWGTWVSNLVVHDSPTFNTFVLIGYKCNMNTLHRYETKFKKVLNRDFLKWPTGNSHIALLFADLHTVYSPGDCIPAACLTSLCSSSWSHKVWLIFKCFCSVSDQLDWMTHTGQGNANGWLSQHVMTELEGCQIWPV